MEEYQTHKISVLCSVKCARILCVSLVCNSFLCHCLFYASLWFKVALGLHHVKDIWHYQELLTNVYTTAFGQLSFVLMLMLCISCFGILLNTRTIN